MATDPDKPTSLIDGANVTNWRNKRNFHELNLLIEICCLLRKLLAVNRTCSGLWLNCLVAELLFFSRSLDFSPLRRSPPGGKEGKIFFFAPGDKGGKLYSPRVYLGSLTEFEICNLKFELKSKSLFFKLVFFEN